LQELRKKVEVLESTNQKRAEELCSCMEELESVKRDRDEGESKLVELVANHQQAMQVGG